MEKNALTRSSKKLWREARRHLVGGVSSPVRSFRSVGGTPVFVEQGMGPYLYNVEGRKYIDYCLSWGAVLLGHAEEGTVEAIQRTAALGTSFGTATQGEVRLAKEIKKAFPRLEKLRFTSSGTEAAMSALRLARGVTRKERIVKFEGCYHGHADGLLVKAGSGLAGWASPDSRGVPERTAQLTSVLPYNDTAAATDLFKRHRDIACVIVEPVAGNMGVVPAEPRFLEALARLTRRSGALLIFDEVITGYRLAYGGAQTLYGIEPDLTVLGKIIGGGMPIGAFGGRAELMDHLAPLGRVYQAGTLSGNPVSVSAGLSVLTRLSPPFYRSFNEKCRIFVSEAGRILRRRHGTVAVQGTGSMFSVFFGRSRVRDFREARACRQATFKRFFHGMLAGGVYLPPSPFESCFVSAAHTFTEFERTFEVMNRC